MSPFSGWVYPIRRLLALSRRASEMPMKASAGLLLSVVALLASPSQATEIAPPLSDYLVTSWVDREGVPIGTVYAIDQDRMGYLWLGTDGGLIRFDGFRFRSADTVV